MIKLICENHGTGYEFHPTLEVLLIYHFPHIYYLKLKWPFSNPAFAYNRTPDLL